MKPSLTFVLLMAAASIAVVNLTGSLLSPLLFVLFFPLLMAVQGGRSRVGFAVALLNTLYIFVAHRAEPALSVPGLIGLAVSFPAVAVFAAVLHQRLEARYYALHDNNDAMASLLDASQMMESAYDLDMTLNLFMLNAEKMSGCDVCAVYLRAKDTDLLELKASSGPKHRENLLSSFPLQEARFNDWSASETSVASSRVSGMYVPDSNSARAEASSTLLSIDPQSRSFACYPLNCVEHFVGMLYVGFNTTEGMPDHVMDLLERLSPRAAFPLQRVLLQQGYHTLAFRDQKTGLDNYRQFDDNLQNEVTRADRYGHRLSLIILDIDHFKRFNDTYGHPAGDALLTQMAVVLRDSLRGVDKPARFGGEEFTVICPETGKDEALVIAERIRANVAAANFTIPAQSAGHGETHVSVTVSVGFATYPMDARTPIDLLKASDVALYAAKAAGRNAVRAHDTDGVVAA